MIKNIIGNILQIQWNTPVEEMKFEGDDTWGRDVNGEVCSLMLTLKGKAETGSDFLDVNQMNASPISDNHRLESLGLVEQFPESQRQFFLDDKILFDYRVKKSVIDLAGCTQIQFSESVAVFVNSLGTIQFVLISGLETFDFYPSSPNDKSFRLVDFATNRREEIWHFFALSCLYQYDCSLDEYKSAIDIGRSLLKDEELPEGLKEYIEDSVAFWEDIIEDDFG